MADFFTISVESMTDFIARHPRGVFTNDVAGRFGMNVNDARRILKRMERQGVVKSELEIAANGAFSGNGLVWTVAAISAGIKTEAGHE